MVLPIVVYGDPVLRKVCVDIEKTHENLAQIIKDMYETMYEANGVGLAAPQVNKAIRLFIVDASPFAEVDEDEEPEFTAEEMKHMNGFKKTFINARILEETGEEWKFNEGCLSIPKIREDVLRKSKLTIEYFDENFKKHTETYDGVIARVIQHEYDHIEGILFTDKINPFKRKLISGKLTDISKGKFRADYKTRVFQPKK
ncbi:MAG: peptide deformylase [Bacteroidia bacterium]|nr:peptide deformylase [Bacteroidia bacterium]